MRNAPAPRRSVAENARYYEERAQKAEQHPQADEIALVLMFDGLEQYVVTYEKRFDQKLSEDGFLGEQWLQMVKGLNQLLNGELGRLSGGRLSKRIYRMVARAGFDESDV